MTSAQRLWPAEITDRVLQLVTDPPRPRPVGATTVLAVDGPSGAGKTTLADELLAELELTAPGTSALVRMEDLYPGWDGLAAALVRLRDEVLRPLLAGRAAEYRRWDWAADDWGARRDVVPPRPVTVVEGVGAGALATAPMLSALVFVDAPSALRHARAMARDGEGYRPYWQRWADQEHAYFSRDRPGDRADACLLPGSFQIRGLG